MPAKTTNIDKVIKALAASGITNPYSIAGILAIISKESGFIPQSEISYANTDNARIRSIFPTRTGSLSEAELTTLKKDPVKFFNFVYDNKYGNGSNEGYKYRGRGFNQQTFKNNYKAAGQALGIDLVKYPDKVNDPDIAAKVVAQYMLKAFKDNAGIVKSRYGASNINDFKDKRTAVNAFFNANAGFGKDTSSQVSDGKSKALAKVDSIYDITVKFLKSPGGKIATGFALLAILAGAAALSSK